MSRLRTFAFSLALMGSLVVWSCGNAPPSTPGTCVPGQSVACVGAGGCSGSQTCTSGETYGPCDCGTLPDGGVADDAQSDGPGFDGPSLDAGDAGADTSTPIDWDAATKPWGHAFQPGTITAVAVNGKQEVLVGGSSVFLEKLSVTGSSLWKKTASAITSSVAFDGAGAMYAIAEVVQTADFGGGIVGAGFYVVKYDAAGTFQWHYGPFPSVYLRQLAVKSNGNVVIVGDLSASQNFGGGAISPTGQRDALLVEITSSKAFVRAKTWGDVSAQDVMAVALDGNDNIFIAGRFAGQINFGGGPLIGPGQGLHNNFIAKLDPSGGYLHQMDTKSLGNNSTISSLATDPTGRVYVGGGVYDNSLINLGGIDLIAVGGYDAVVGLLDSSLGHVWSKRYGDSSGQYVGGLAVDPSGGVAVTGAFSGSLDFGLGAMTLYQGLFVARMSASGKTLENYGVSVTNGSADGRAIAFLSWPDFVVVGQCLGGSLPLPSGSISCDPNGTGFAARLQP